jgi:hypothetical protein
MNTVVEQQNAEAKKHLYLQRINQLYAKIGNWLQDEPLILENGKIEVIEALGKYKAPQLTIKTQKGEQLAEFKPAGASVLLAEGTIDVEGWLDRGYVVYMLASNPQTFYNIKVDGWYWQEQRLNTEPHFLNKTWLLQIVTWVSDHEF